MFVLGKEKREKGIDAAQHASPEGGGESAFKADDCIESASPRLTPT